MINSQFYKSSLLLSILVIFCLAACKNDGKQKIKFQYFDRSTSSFSPHSKYFFLQAIYGTKFRKSTRPVIFNLENRTIVTIPNEDLYFSSKPNWNNEGIKLVTTIFEGSMKLPEKNKENEKIPEELLKYLRKYKKFREYEKQYKKKAEKKLPRITILNLEDNKIEYPIDPDKNNYYGISPAYSNEFNKIFCMINSEKEEDDFEYEENLVEFDLIELDLSSGEKVTLINDFKYDDFYKIPDHTKLMLCNNPDELKVIEIYDYMNKNSVKIFLDANANDIVKDVTLKNGINSGIITTQSENGFDRYWKLDFVNLTIEELKINDKGWISIIKVISEDVIEYVHNSDGNKIIITYDLTKNKNISEYTLNFNGDIIGFNSEIVFYINLENKLMAYNRDDETQKIIYPDE